MFIIDFVKTQPEGESLYGLFYKPEREDLVKINYAERNTSVTEKYDEEEFEEEKIYKICESTSTVELTNLIKGLIKNNPTKLINSITEGAISAFELQHEELIKRERELIIANSNTYYDIIILPVFRMWKLTMYALVHLKTMGNGTATYSYLRVLSPFITKKQVMIEAEKDKELLRHSASDNVKSVNIIFKEFKEAKKDDLITAAKNNLAYYLRIP